jgi:hypothetical protein
MNEDSQREAIAKHLRQGKSLTALQALAKFQCLRLSGRIYDLRAEGMNIQRTMVKIGAKRVARYSLA